MYMSEALMSIPNSSTISVVIILNDRACIHVIWCHHLLYSVGDVYSRCNPAEWVIFSLKSKVIKSKVSSSL